MKNRRGKLIVAFLVAAVVLIMVPVGGRLYVQHAASQLKLPPLTTGDSTILASDDTVLGHIASSGGGHTSLTDAQVPDLIRQAHMAAEDRGFYKHGAVSLTGTA
jgi:membrane peptidoglycan carboxypeptidase